MTAPRLALAPTPSPRDRAIWHLRELERLIYATGAGSVTVMAIGINYPQNLPGTPGKVIVVNHDGRLMDFDGILDGAAA